MNGSRGFYPIVPIMYTRICADRRKAKRLRNRHGEGDNRPAVIVNAHVHGSFAVVVKAQAGIDQADVSAGLSGQRGLDGIAGLPACRDTGHSAKRDKKKGLYTAVSF